MPAPTARELIEAYKRGVSMGFATVALRDRAEASFALALEALEGVARSPQTNCAHNHNPACDCAGEKVRRAIAAMNGVPHE